MNPDELYAHSLGIRLDAPIEFKAKAVAPKMDRLIDDIPGQPHVVMSEDTYNLLICCNHELHDEADRLRARLRKARELPWWFGLAMLAACVLGAIAGMCAT